MNHVTNLATAKHQIAKIRLVLGNARYHRASVLHNQVSAVLCLYLVLFRKADNELHKQIVSNACLNKHTGLLSELTSRYAKSRHR